MGTLTLDQLRSEIKSGLGNRTELVLDNTRVDRLLNLSQTRMARRQRFKELDATESYTPTFAGVPATDKVIAFSSLTNSNVRAIYSIRVINGTSSWKLAYVPHRMWDRRNPSPEALGTNQPSRYTVYAKQVELYRVPDAAYEYVFRLATWPTVLSTAAQVSDFDEKDDALIAMACHLFFRSLRNTEAAAEWLKEYRDIMGESILEDEDNPDLDSVDPHRGDSGEIGDYWTDPFVRSSP